MNTPVNPNELDPSVFQFTTGWDSAVESRSVLAMFGALVLILTIRVLWKRDCTILAGTLWGLLGAACVVFSMVPQQIVTFVISTDYTIRIRVIMGGLSIFVLLITLESIRRTRLQERYALLWVATAFMLLLCAIFPQAVNLFRAITGMQYDTAVAAVAFTFLALLAFHFSTSMSAMESDRDKIAQKLAVLEARLKELEKKSANERPGNGRKSDRSGAPAK
jgi:hypothetical protein